MSMQIIGQPGFNDSVALARNSAPNLTTGQKLEAIFLSEMLKVSGLGKTSASFGGGIGEDQFSSFLREAQAREMVKAGGLGLAKHFDRALSKGNSN